MYVLLGNKLVSFFCDSKQAEHQLGLLFRDWLKFEPPSSSEPSTHTGGQVQLRLETVDVVDWASEIVNPIFADQNSQTRVFQGEHWWHIYFGVDAVAHIPIPVDDDSDVVITAQVARTSLTPGRLEDIILSSLAPILRVHGLFMIHAFAVEKEGSALLLVGESGSGKTTTGLSLLAHQWRYLANDVTLIAAKNGVIFALPTPGGIGLDLNSAELLTNLAIPKPSIADKATKYYYPATSLVAGWGESAPVSQIIFPTVDIENAGALSPVARSVVLARLMEASVDRWDRLSFQEHIRVMTSLSRQADGFDMRVGQNLQRLPGTLYEMRRRDPGSTPR